jgi:hypothetical protein
VSKQNPPGADAPAGFSVFAPTTFAALRQHLHTCDSTGFRENAGAER